MRRTRSARIPPTRRQLAFEPLEPRELLAADAGLDWSSYWAAQTDDWSWTFDDSWNSAGVGTDTSWNDGWWAGDVAWDPSSTGGSDATNPDATAPDAGWSEWTADIGSDSGGWTADSAALIDVATPDPAVVDVVPADAPAPAPGIDVPTPQQPVPEVAAPQAEVPATVAEPGSSIDTIEVVPPPFANDSGVSDPPDVIEAADASGPPVVDVPVEPVIVVETGSAAGTDFTTVDVTTDKAGTDVGVPDHATLPASDVGGITGNPSTGQPSTVVVPAPAAGSPSPVADPVAAADRPAAGTFAGNPLGSWGAFLFQNFGRPDAAADAAPSDGRTGTGRPRLRLPFRPIV